MRPRECAARIALGAALAASACGLAASACTPSDGSRGAPGFATAYVAASADAGAALGFRAVRGSGAASGWAVGEGGMAVELVSGKWYPLPSSSTATLGGLAALDVGHAFAVELGGARVLGWDGRTWSPVGADRADRAAAATFALAPNDVWVAGDGVEHWDGRSWSQQIPGGARFTALSGSFDTDVWAVGPGGAQHYDGHAWTAVAAPGGTLAAVWVAGLEDAWLVGAQGTVLHSTGNVLTTFDTGTMKDLTSVTATSSTDVWIGGQDGLLMHFDGAQWTRLLTPTMRTIDDVWAAVGGDVLLADGTSAITSYTP